MKRKVAEAINLLFGMRKFILMLLLLVIGSIFRVKDLVNGAEMVDLFKTTTIAFFSVNGIEHLLSFGKDYVASKVQSEAQQVADLDESNDNDEVKMEN